MPVEPLNQAKNEPLDYVTDVARKLKENGASSQTIDDAISKTTITEGLQKTVKILSWYMREGHNSSEYQEQLLYPSHPNP